MDYTKLESMAIEYIKTKRKFNSLKEELDSAKEDLINALHETGKTSITAHSITLYLEPGKEKITEK